MTDYPFWWEKGIPFENYFQNFENELINGSQKPNADKLPINKQRMTRILKTYRPAESLQSKLNSLSGKRNWLVISEHWCGDSAQIIPVMFKIAQASSGKINLRLIYRDDYPEFMDAHLTNGGKSIPKLIQLDENFNVTGMYGPRPEFAMNLVKTLKSNPETASTYSEELHKWYATDKQKSIALDLEQLLS